MTKKRNCLFIVGGILILTGLILALIVLINNKFDFSKLDNSSYTTNTHQLNDSFNEIVINTNTADIEFIFSDELNKVECFESTKEIHEVKVLNGKLTINVTNERKWFDYIGFNFKTPIIKVYLNKNTYDSIIINEDTGDIKLPKEFSFKTINISASTGDISCHASGCEYTKIDLSTGNIQLTGINSNIIELNTSTGNVTLNDIISSNIKLNSSTGKTTLTNVLTNELISNASTGDIVLNNVIGSKFVIERSTGDILFNKSDAQELYIKTDTGDVCGTLLSNKIFKYDTDTGDVDLPDVMSGGSCTITTDTGDIKISIES